MRRCKRCKNLKPDAVFLREGIKEDNSRRYRKGWCLHCRTIKEEMKGESSPPPRVSREISPSSEDLRLISLAREERERWRVRRIPRVYSLVYDGVSPSVGRRGSPFA